MTAVKDRFSVIHDKIKRQIWFSRDFTVCVIKFHISQSLNVIGVADFEKLRL